MSNNQEIQFNFMETTENNSNKKNFVTISLMGIIFIIFHLVSAFFPNDYLWGVDQWFYLPAGLVAILFIVASFLFLVPKSAVNKLNFSLFSGKIYFFLIPLLSALPFWVFRQKMFLLGDGTILLRSIETGVMYKPEEPLEYLVHSAFYGFMNKYFSVTPQLSWAVISIFCGVLFVFFSMLIADYLGKTDLRKFLIFTSIITTGTIQLFFGYVETYSITALLVLVSIYFAVTSFEKKNHVYYAFFVFSFSVCFHPSAAGFSPAFFYLFIVTLKKRDGFFRKIYHTALTGILAVFPVAIMLSLFHSAGFFLKDFLATYSGGEHILPLSSNGLSHHVPYTLFSLKHILDIINEYLLIAPLTVFAGVLLIKKAGRMKNLLSEKLFTFLLIASAFTFLFCFIFNHEKGFSRDWDIFSHSALPLTIFSILVIIKFCRYHLRRTALILTGCCLLHVLPWVVVNSSENYSLARFQKTAESSSWSRLAQSDAYDELRSYYDEKKEYKKSLQYALKAYLKQSNNARLLKNLSRAYNNAAWMEMKQKNLLKAENYFVSAHHCNPSNHKIVSNIGAFYFNQKEFNNALYYFRQAYEMKAESLELLKYLIMTYKSLGETKKARLFIEKYLKLQEKSHTRTGSSNISVNFNRD